ncbi:hypothetical protein PybrP1_004600 [[Pythium] brassicae (nom. inval.)]|nr:hypothetical protein PybrP1_004600 [[Pythium] brassicae (nom. inval.)]
MKTFFALAALAMIQASGAAVAAQQTTGDIKSEFLRWKASEAGKQAYKNNLVPARRSSTSRMSLMDADEPTEDELTRFQNSIDAVARIQEQQPQATFSINTPFALMTKDEFQAYVAKSKVQEHLKEVEKRLNPPMPVAESATAAATSLNASSAVAAAAAATGISAGAGSLSAGLESTSTVGVTANSTSTSTSTTITVMNNGTRRLDTWVVDVDWQTKGCVTRIKNQGACGVCWAFAATGALESAYCAKTGKLYELSEQEVVSCSRDKASCDGGFAGYTYDWLTRLNGGSICTEKSYPFVSGEGNAPSCKLYDGASAKCEKPNLGAYFYDGGFFPDHKQLEAAVLKQPVAMSIAAYGDAFQYYTGGVLMGDEKNCPVDKINHEIILVGFGTLNGVPYWKVKNQWSEAWGDHGYMYIERGYQGHEFGACGVEKYGFYPKFPATSDPGLSKRTTTPRWGYAISGQQLRVLLGIWEPEQCASRCTQDASCVGYNWFPNPLYWCELKSTNTGLVSASTSSGSVISKAESLSKG